VNMTVFGPSHVSHDAEHHLHESPPSMTVPLMILAGLSIVGGWIGWPEALGGSDRFAEWLAPVIAKPVEAAAGVAETQSRLGMEYALMAASVMVALVGIWSAYQFYIKNPSIPEKLAASFPGVHRLLYNKYYVDQIYDALFVNRTKDLATTLGAFDRGVINGLGVDGVGWLTRTISSISAVWDKWIIDGILNLVSRIVYVLSYPVRMIQNGRVGSYALLIVLGVLLFLGYYLHIAGAFKSALHL
jgi:NADH-quinone oxidoreductase subunit L